MHMYIHDKGIGIGVRGAVSSSKVLGRPGPPPGLGGAGCACPQVTSKGGGGGKHALFFCQDKQIIGNSKICHWFLCKHELWKCT